ncbi:DUF4367 domain-containing protein [Paenibacillus sp. AD87]|uniref:DUF4367 domain-containing protein n=1 Tax=Paenibacillus sp. AD87 TaxID=1528787 RepID=UPI0007E4550C|nr:DUF4367 domain-containing protein [Paenibacillus sp. AD87]OAX47032.1 hypothetical protein gpAD87_02665 [Paenibacillus sp. AD87]
MLKRIVSLIFIFTLSVGITNDLLIASAKPTQAFSNVDLDKLKTVADFKLLTPSYLGGNYKLEIKEPYPFVISPSVSKVRLHFFDESGQTYLFGIEEHKAGGYKVNRVVTNVDVRYRTSKTRTIVEDFKFNEHGETININGIEGRFEPSANHHILGGYLRWVQNDTFIEMDSKELTKEEMIALAKSMR